MITADIRAQAAELGFSAVGIARPEVSATVQARFDAMVAADAFGDMSWMASTAQRRRDPAALWPAARSVIVLAQNYTPDHDPMTALAARTRGNVSVYARFKDYHDVMKKRLKTLARWLVAAHGGEVKVFVDTAPILEKPLAQRAGVGWQGKHSNLVSRELGSWFFLGEVFTTLELPADAPGEDHCGVCTRCIDICPTAAITAPYQLDPGRCIAYLTIEHKGHIDRVFRPAIGNRVFGCDDCLAVCPWNKFATPPVEAAYRPAPPSSLPDLADLAALDDDGFRARFRGTPVRRLGRDRFLRNVLIAIGNSAQPALAPAAAARLDDSAPVVRAMAVWALARLLPTDDFAALRQARAPRETDPEVCGEWAMAAAD